MSDSPNDSDRSWVVLKFGGTSVASAERWERIATRIRSLSPAHRVWVVASALSGVSDDLARAIERAAIDDSGATVRAIVDRHERLADAVGLDSEARAPFRETLTRLASWLEGIGLTGEAPPRLVARIMALGELASTRLGVAILARSGVETAWVDARQLLCSESPPTDAAEQRYLDARVRSGPDRSRAEGAAGGSPVVLTQGFIAATPERETCLLGRGGSDTSGALFAAMLEAERFEIWSDVHGLFTADPRQVPTARLIRRIGFREAQELAAMGAKVLHPRCLDPVRRAGVPVSLHSIEDPDREGTLIEIAGPDHPAITAVTCRRAVTLLSISTLEMWGESGFLARAFAPFDELGISIDLVATSQATISVTLDRIPGGVGGPAFARLIERLERFSKVKIVHPCAVVSIVGRRTRAVLHELGPAMSVFQERPVHLISDSADDLNLSFVVDEQDAPALVARLHERLFSTQGGDPRFGPTWEVLGGSPEVRPAASAWWRVTREELVAIVRDGRPRYVYHLPTVVSRARALAAALPSTERLYYSMKANPHPALLRALSDAGFGLECVSADEVRHARAVIGRDTPLLFTPNLCALDEYAAAFEAGADVVIDGPEPLLRRPDLFAGRAIGARVDTGRGLGHHEKVRTAGAQAKFGQPIDEMEAVAAAARDAGATIVGLHAHVGSGILDPTAWEATGERLASLLDRFDAVEWLDPGGGLGVVERPGQRELDLAALEAGLARLRRRFERVGLRLEPGRFLVSEAGALVAPVTQVRTKGGVRFIGLATGMNALIRPALYGAWHGIHNLTRLDEAPAGYAHVVGPICETGDVLGRDRLLPATSPGDVMLIENAGAYGAVMASCYNLREKPEEIVLEE